MRADRVSRCATTLPLLGSNQDSPDPESGPWVGVAGDATGKHVQFPPIPAESPTIPHTASHRAALNDRQAFIVAMRNAGHTLEEIATPLRISRERVRQLLVRAGVEPRSAGLLKAADPIAYLRFARSHGCASMAECARHYGVTAQSVEAVFRLLGVSAALKRLYRWRIRTKGRARMIAALQRFALEHGRSPTGLELNRVNGQHPYLPWAFELTKFFGSMGAAYRMAGFTVRPLGGRGLRGPATHCKRGHEFAAENTYTYHAAGGKTIRACKACSRLRKRVKRGAA